MGVNVAFIWFPVIALVGNAFQYPLLVFHKFWCDTLPECYETCRVLLLHQLRICYFLFCSPKFTIQRIIFRTYSSSFSHYYHIKIQELDVPKTSIHLLPELQMFPEQVFLLHVPWYLDRTEKLISYHLTCKSSQVDSPLFKYPNFFKSRIRFISHNLSILGISHLLIHLNSLSYQWSQATLQARSSHPKISLMNHPMTISVLCWLERVIRVESLGSNSMQHFTLQNTTSRRCTNLLKFLPYTLYSLHLHWKNWCLFQSYVFKSTL